MRSGLVVSYNWATKENLKWDKQVNINLHQLCIDVNCGKQL